MALEWRSDPVAKDQPVSVADHPESADLAVDQLVRSDREEHEITFIYSLAASNDLAWVGESDPKQAVRKGPLPRNVDTSPDHSLRWHRTSHGTKVFFPIIKIRVESGGELVAANTFRVNIREG